MTNCSIRCLSEAGCLESLPRGDNVVKRIWKNGQAFSRGDSKHKSFLGEVPAWA